MAGGGGKGGRRWRGCLEIKFSLTIWKSTEMSKHKRLAASGLETWRFLSQEKPQELKGLASAEHTRDSDFYDVLRSA